MSSQVEPACLLSAGRTTNVVCAIDEAYAQHCGAMLCSLFVNNPDREFTVFALNTGVSAAARRRLDTVACSHNQRPLIWRDIDLDLLRHAPVFGHVSVATYFRILIPRLVPEDVETVLFLDSDVIVRRNIADLLDEPLQGYTHAAVKNPLCAEHVRRLGLSGSTYFNAGVLLLNLRIWRQERLSDLVLDYIATNAASLLWWDQDALNATLGGRWRRCRSTWNAQHAIFTNLSDAELGIAEDERLEARTNPHIVHYTGSLKPWTYYSQHPFKKDYYRYLARTPWAGYRPADTPSPAERLRQLAGSLAPAFVKPGYRRLAAALRNGRTAVTPIVARPKTAGGHAWSSDDREPPRTGTSSC